MQSLKADLHRHVAENAPAARDTVSLAFRDGPHSALILIYATILAVIAIALWVQYRRATGGFTSGGWI